MLKAATLVQADVKALFKVKKINLNVYALLIVPQNMIISTGVIYTHAKEIKAHKLFLIIH